MKTKVPTYSLVSIGILCVLCACSDSTQFTERTFSTSQAEEAKAKQNASADASSSESKVQSEEGLEYGSTVDTEMPSEPVTAEVDEGSSVPPEPVLGKGGSDNPTQNKGTDNPGQNSGPAAPPTPVVSNGLFSICEDNPQQAIVAKIYPLAESTQKIPEFNPTMQAGDDVCLSQLNISERKFTEGFPGVYDLIEWFGLDINFKVNVPTAGQYTFTLNSDDGSLLFIDGAAVIDNDGLHQTREKSAKIYLSKGIHTFNIKYFQGPRYHIALELFWQIPGASTRSYIPPAYISRP